MMIQARLDCMIIEEYTRLQEQKVSLRVVETTDETVVMAIAA